ncbi:MAG TPA: hypothetical protein VH518_08020 [Tepidisphaeraceae bacterium]
MNRNQRLPSTLSLHLLLAMIICSPAFAQTVEPSDSETPAYHDDIWHASVSPYLWLAGANGTIGFRGREVKIDQSFTDIFSNLKFGVMGLSDVRRGRISLLTDLMYIRLGDEKAIPVQGLPNAVDVKASLNTFTLTPYFGYRIVGSRRGSIDFLTGGRYYHIGSTITADGGSAGKISSSTSDNWADFVEGARFNLNITPRIGAFFLGDVGGGGSVLTWQIVGGVGYRWNKRWSTALGYRRLYFNRQTNTGVGIEQTQQGLVVGATFRFR